MSAQRASIRLFESETLERLSFAGPRLIVAVWLPLIVLATVHGAGHASAAAAIPTAGVALFGWTLFEYAMHRFIFHLRPKSKAGKWLMFLLHGCHHADPQDPRRNVMTPALTLLVGGLFLAAFLAVAGSALGAIAFAGFMTGYLAYDLIHYACHQMDVAWMRGIKRRHLAHHFAGQEANFAVTFPFWDRLFGTPLRKREAARRHRARVDDGGAREAVDHR